MKRLFATTALGALAFVAFAAAPAFADVCNRRFPVTVGEDTLYQRYCANYDITVESNKPQRTVVVLQSSSINADDYCAAILNDLEAIAGTGASENTLVVCPHFLSEVDEGENIVTERNVDTGANWTMCTSGFTDDLYWPSSTWKDGNESRETAGGCTQRPFVIWSYGVMDLMLDAIADNFPNALNDITFIGQSAGGQFLNRYPGFATLPAGIEMENIRWLPVNPSSAPWFNTKRPDVGQSVTWPIVLDVPGSTSCDGTGPDDSDESDYNDWPDGWADVSSTFETVDAFGSATWKAQMETARMWIGHELTDNYDNGGMANDCGAWLQHGQTAASGQSRLHRGHGWFENWIDEFGYRKIAEGTLSFNFTNHGGAHGGEEYFTDECGRLFLWDLDGGTACSYGVPEKQRDTFDTDLSFWTASGTGTVAISGEDRNRGAGAARFEPGSSAKTLTAPAINEAGVYTVAMMLRNHPLVATGEGFVIEANEDGGGWAEVADLDGNVDTENEWIAVGFSSGIVDTSFQVRIKFTSAAGYGYLDDFIVLRRYGVESTP